MRMLVPSVLLLLSVAACADGPVTKANAAYQACLDAKPVADCQNEKARFDAEIEAANAKSSRIQAVGIAARAARPAAPAFPPPRQSITCTTFGNTTTCQ